jgi:predicted nucleic acid-binding protein
MIVLDTSAILDGYFQPPCWSKLISLIKSQTILVPQHFTIECISGLRRIDRHRRLSDIEVAAFKFFVEQMPLIFVPTMTLLESIWEKRHTISAYDANYVAIAETANATLITHDEKLASAALGLVKIMRLDTPAP